MKNFDPFWFDEESWQLVLAHVAAAPARKATAVQKRRKSLRRFHREKDQRALDRMAAKHTASASVEAKRRHAGPVRDAVLRVLTADHWVGAVDVAMATGADRRTINHTLNRLRRHALVRRVVNPDWKGNVRNVEPQYLWQLTESGAAAQRKA